jgi:hypothetical protein
MELKEFVSESLKQIIDGVIDAQTYAKSKGASIIPSRMIYTAPSNNIPVVLAGMRGEINKPVQIMEFDVAVTVTQTGEAKAGLGIFSGALGIGAQAKLEDGNVLANRIKFSVPFLFPEQT